MTTFKDLNEKKIVIRIGNGILIYCIIQIIIVLLIYKQTKLNLPSDLIPEFITCDIFGYYVNSGLIYALAVLLMAIAKFNKQNLLISIIGVLAFIGEQINISLIK